MTEVHSRLRQGSSKDVIGIGLIANLKMGLPSLLETVPDVKIRCSFIFSVNR